MKESMKQIEFFILLILAPKLQEINSFMKIPKPEINLY